MHLIKKRCLPFIGVLLTIWLCFAQLGSSASAYTFTPDFSIHSEAAIVYSQDADMIVYEKNADKAEMPAHLIQIVTALVVMDLCDTPNTTTITANEDLYTPFYSYDYPDDLRYAQIYNGDTLTVTEYLYALTLTSSCEAAVILADHFGNGNQDVFVKKMNEKVAEIGCTDTVIQNPTGLYDAKQTTTARDMLKITQYALEQDWFNTISNTVSYTPTSANPTNHPDAAAWIWTHSNTMLLKGEEVYYEGASGIKTGNLTEAGRNIITSAAKEDHHYLIILLNAPFTDEDDALQYYHIEDATDLLNWAFSSLSYQTLLDCEKEQGEVSVENSEDNAFVLVRPKENCILLWCEDVDPSIIKYERTLEKSVQAPVKKGDVLGTLELKYAGDEIAKVDLVAINDVDRSFSKFNLYALTNFKNSPYFHYALLLAIALSMIYIFVCLYASMKNKQKNKPEDPIHLIPKAVHLEQSEEKEVPKEKPLRPYQRSEPVFYRRPTNPKQADSKQKDNSSSMHPDK